MDEEAAGSAPVEPASRVAGCAGGTPPSPEPFGTDVNAWTDVVVGAGVASPRQPGLAAGTTPWWMSLVPRRSTHAVMVPTRAPRNTLRAKFRVRLRGRVGDAIGGTCRPPRWIGEGVGDCVADERRLRTPAKLEQRAKAVAAKHVDSHRREPDDHDYCRTQLGEVGVGRAWWRVTWDRRCAPLSFRVGCCV